jgi:predicted RND superfamily exporter protein
MLPNLLPVTIVFGAMGWLNIPLDVASILTASVALGIAVDDTLHCTYWYLRYRRAGQQATAAMMEALRKCARPMLHTTLICTGAMVPFLFCEFLPTGKFALLMILILSGALLCDLIFLPGLLCSPFGRWIGNSRQAGGSDSSTTAVQNENGVTPSDTI